MKKTSVSYVNAIALKHGITKAKARQLILFAIKNMGRKIMHGQDIRIPGFGNFYFHKKTYVKYLSTIKKNELKKQKRKQ